MALQIAGVEVSIEEIGIALAELKPEEFISAVRNILNSGGGDQLQLLIQGLEIQMTPSAFTPENSNLIVLEQVAQEYPLTRWLKGMGIATTTAKRFHICRWWETFMLMASEHGYVPFGQIDQISRSTNLWKATGPLAGKMQKNPAAYRFLPALLINHPQEVTRVLGELMEAEPFVEVLTGERFEDLRTSSTFLGAFSIVEDENGVVSRTVANAIFSMAMVLQR
ncbi:hypothetical protein HY734_02130 [Candidatus Uhrbacteria bacterium]|nr:hypothetical protein [Candidatus Uhrbacteria bacterium]